MIETESVQRDVCPGLIFNFEDRCPSKICKSVSYQLIVDVRRQLLSVCGQLPVEYFLLWLHINSTNDARLLETQDGIRGVSELFCQVIL